MSTICTGVDVGIGPFDRTVKQLRIVQNEGRDEDGDLVYRDGLPHPASGLREVPESMAKLLRAGGER